VLTLTQLGLLQQELHDTPLHSMVPASLKVFFISPKFFNVALFAMDIGAALFVPNCRATTA
jgi:hypothetical protein